MKHKLLVFILSIGLLTTFVSCGEDKPVEPTNIPVVSVRLSEREVTLKVGATYQLEVTVYPNNNTTS